jgi:hypothetical protein
MSPEEIIAEACKLPAPALEKIAETLSFEALGRRQEKQPKLRRCSQ